jgi:hypothetical protein
MNKEPKINPIKSRAKTRKVVSDIELEIIKSIFCDLCKDLRRIPDYKNYSEDELLGSVLQLPRSKDNKVVFPFNHTDARNFVGIARIMLCRAGVREPALLGVRFSSARKIFSAFEKKDMKAAITAIASFFHMGGFVNFYHMAGGVDDIEINTREDLSGNIGNHLRFVDVTKDEFTVAEILTVLDKMDEAADMTGPVSGDDVLKILTLTKGRLHLPEYLKKQIRRNNALAAAQKKSEAAFEREKQFDVLIKEIATQFGWSKYSRLQMAKRVLSKIQCEGLSNKLKLLNAEITVKHINNALKRLNYPVARTGKSKI